MIQSFRFWAEAGGCEARTSGPDPLFSYVDLEARVGQSHPLRAIRKLVNEALAVLVNDFSALYSPIGRPSIRRNRREVPERGIGSARREAAFEYGAFFGRRHANRSLGVDEELQTNRWVERTSCGWGWTEPGKGLSRPEAIERNAHLDHRSRSEALS